MTKLAKILIFITVALSIMMAAWALGVYTNHIDWSANKATGDRSAGELAKRIDRITLLRSVLSGTAANDDKTKADAVNAVKDYRGSTENKPRTEETAGGAENHWRTAWAVLYRNEYYRADYQNWYAQELKKLETGNDKVMTVVYNEGTLVLDKNGRPQLQEYLDANKKPLYPLDNLRRALADEQKKLDAALVKVGTLIKEETALTEELAGKEGNGGMRGQLAREQVKGQKVNQEREDLKPLLINTAVESQLLIKRKEQLEQRVNELKTR